MLDKVIFSSNQFQPLTWEWVWFAGAVLMILVGSQAMKTSKAMFIQVYMALVILFGFVPIIWCKLVLEKKMIQIT